ncbi:GspH/FimT family pseudopilin [Pleionea sediminis]|uniref:GspH/FimT family pseudopilin n=1 Tax=Pleionea sediminis TaxID=2569479 RepID=UPI0011858E2A|nr:GspH/FimT family pseudopilin [Pleionea sediminis]
MNCKGFTIIELLFAIAILFILTVFALPAFSNFLDRSKIQTEAMQLMATIKTAREKSISSGDVLVLCGKKKDECGKKWSEGYLLFTDKNNDRQFTEDIDTLLFSHNYNDDNIHVKWRSFRASKPIHFLPSGITWHNNGTFILCLDKDPKLAKALFVAKTGRIEMSRDTNYDEYDEDRDGDKLKCT